MEILWTVGAHNLVGESALWHPEEQRVYWVDVNGFRIHRYRPADHESRIWQFKEPVCALALTTEPGRLIVALASRLILWNPETDEQTDFARPEPDKPSNRLNDASPAPDGSYWVGSMQNNIAPDGSPIEAEGQIGSLYRISASGAVTVLDTGYGIPNTLAWSLDLTTFYCADSKKNLIYAYDYESGNSRLGNRRVFLGPHPRGVPDGSAMDAEGCLWNCRHAGGCILRISPQGKVDRVIDIPTSNVTSCTFGGPDLRTLFVTTAALGAPESEPLRGALFALRSDVAGLPSRRFRIGASRSAAD